eukprot:CAMPEP_0178510342 /NCGR_PEP_ID=MMETSP0696-20121128/21779_1 /TAXON_ID=265572 /ORGANISM="Extubocellulus spinifer, Strain CCMP396" /LENGTH=986 /DNA_ID=CAMNT_0020140045 /DNA_START=34 /DNA_END=2994 /DNA_ORIENTATION=-
MSMQSSSIGIFGQKSLTDVVKGIRATKRDTALFISACIAEIKTEIGSTDPQVKTIALQKLTFLQMMGYDMSFASFTTIEVMSSIRFAHKRVGYLAASQGFNQNTDVILLTTNLLKKELRGAVGGGMSGVYDAGLAVNCLSNIVTQDLARELLPDLTNLLSHPQPYIRKRAVLCMFKLFAKYPQGLMVTFPRIQQCLEDPNPSVVSCAVNVIAELSDKNPRNYLPLAPAFFNLLTSSSNNWMLIKVVKLLGSLVPEEPRLARKLLDPLAGIVKTTQAKSLLYEAVYTITLCLPYCRKSDGSMPASVPTIVELCATTLRSFVEDTDQNLKYLGLVGFASLMSSHPRVLSASNYRPLILACLSDEDITIRSRSLDLLGGMATRKNLMELVNQLLMHVDQAVGSYKSDLVEKIVNMCSAEKYAQVQDFSWYLDVLVSLGHMMGIDRTGSLIARQIVDVSLRVLPVRVHAVRKMTGVIADAASRYSYATSARLRQEDQLQHIGHMTPEMLPAAAWIIGEYSSLIPSAAEIGGDDGGAYASSIGPYHAVIVSLTYPSHAANTPVQTQMVYVQAATKVFCAAFNDKKCKNEEIKGCIAALETNLPVYKGSPSPEVQERALTLHCLLSRLGLMKRQFHAVSKPGIITSSSNDSVRNEKVDDLLSLLSSRNGSGDNHCGDKSSESLSVSAIGLDSSSISSDHTNDLKSRNAKTIEYLLTSVPMKPVSAKALKKKSQCPPALLKTNVESPIDAGTFASVFDGAPFVAADGNFNADIEVVTFSQQFPAHTTGGGTAHSKMSGLQLDGAGNSGPSSTSTQNQGERTSRSESDSPTKEGTMPRQSLRHDPFYLNFNGGDSLDKTSDDVTLQPGRFGTIQLTDSNDDAVTTKRKKRQKQRRRKAEKKEKAELAKERVPEQFAVYSSNGSEEDRGEVMASFQQKQFEGSEETQFGGKKSTKKRRGETEKTKKSKKKKSTEKMETRVDDLLHLGGEKEYSKE